MAIRTSDQNRPCVSFGPVSTLFAGRATGAIASACAVPLPAAGPVNGSPLMASSPATGDAEAGALALGAGVERDPTAVSTEAAAEAAGVGGASVGGAVGGGVGAAVGGGVGGGGGGGGGVGGGCVGGGVGGGGVGGGVGTGVGVGDG